ATRLYYHLAQAPFMRWLLISEKNEMFTLAGPFFYPPTYPDWVNDLTNEQIEEIVISRVRYLIINYPQIDAWIGLNEYFPTSWGIRPDIIQDRLGYDDFLTLVYQTAQEALDQTNNRAFLIYNQDHNHSLNHDSLNGINYRDTLEIINRLKNLGIRNLAVGLQMHIDAKYPPSKDEIIQAMRSYGVPVFITELDVDISNLSSDYRLLTQAQIYHTIFSAALESGVCYGIFMFQMGDKYSWLETDLGKPNADPTPYTDNLDPKPAFYAMIAALLEHLQK
ncbi:MAG: endo-1,4-beta-xylanase, partial [Chloroflexia bacterium]